MASAGLTVTMLGNFSIRCGDVQIGYGDNRSRKVWLLLAYLIYCRKRTVSTEDLLNLLWNENDVSSNALKITLHRARICLDQLYSGAGHELILYRAGTYTWNTDIPLTVDVEEFDALCKGGLSEESSSEQLVHRIHALESYQGDFLEKLSSSPWVMPISVYFHNLYINTLLHTLPLMEQSDRWEDICHLCRNALRLEPYSEPLCRSYMNALFQLGQQQDAIRVYESMSKLLLSECGIMPNDETRALYRKLLRTDTEFSITPESLREYLQEGAYARGAMVCEYDFFRMIYQSNVRMLERTGSTIHIALLSLSGISGKELSRRSLDHAMENLIATARGCLRRGDIIAQCSASQIVVMLPACNYENSEMVCQRIATRFYQQYSNTPVRLYTAVQSAQ